MQIELTGQEGCVSGVSRDSYSTGDVGTHVAREDPQDHSIPTHLSNGIVEEFVLLCPCVCSVSASGDRPGGRDVSVSLALGGSHEKAGHDDQIRIACFYN
jgi:hypothetical protein